MAPLMFWRRTTTGLAACVVLFAFAPLATAGQQGAAPSTTSQSPLVLQPLKSDIIIAPEFRVTKLNGSSANLAGGYVGWLSEDALLIGGGGYWLTNPSSGRKLAYGGLVAQVRMNGDQPIAFGAKILVGGGSATVTGALSDFVRFRPDMHMGVMQPTPVGALFRVRDNFLVAEPEADLLLRVTDRVHLNVGASYRLIGWSNGLEDQVQGAAGSVSLQFAVGK